MIKEFFVDKKKEIKGEELLKIISRVNRRLVKIKDETETLDRITKIADQVKDQCRIKLQSLIDLTNTYKRTLIEKVEAAIEEIAEGEVK